MKYCRNCGWRMNDDDTVCASCGTKDETAQQTPNQADQFRSKVYTDTEFAPKVENNSSNYQSNYDASQSYDFDTSKKFCEKCGHQVHKDAIICPNCGCSVDKMSAQQHFEKVNNQRPGKGLITAIKIFLILSCLAGAVYVVPLFWMVPMTIHAFKKYDRGEPLSTGFKVCTLIFVNTIAGILMLCDKN